MSASSTPLPSSDTTDSSASPLHLLSSVQQLLQTTHNLSASYHHSLSQLTTRLHSLDDRTTRLLNEQHRLRLGLEWLREKGQLLPSSPLPTPAATAATPAALDLTTTLFSLFTQPTTTFTSRPFSYHTEVCYRRLLWYVRRHPKAIVPAAMAEASPNVLLEQRRWLGGLCRGLVCDVMGDGRGAADADGAAGGGASAVEFIEATLIRMQAVMRRRTEKRRAEDEEARKEKERDEAQRRHSTQQSEQADSTAEHIDNDDDSAPSRSTSSTSPLPALTITTTHSSLTSLLSSSTSDIPILPASSAYTFSVLDHSSLPLKLLHEYNLRYGQRYLQSTLVSSIQLVLEEQQVDLNIDLMGPSPRSAGPPAVAGSAGAGEKLFGICGHLMDAIVLSTAAMPPGMRRLARLLFRLGSSASPTTTQSSTSTTGLMSSPSSPYRLVSDYLFLNYLINALMHPSSYSLLPPASPPLSPLHRRNLQVVATVLIKVMSGSRFVFEGGRLQQLNEAVEEWRERVIRFIDGIVEEEDTVEAASELKEEEVGEESGEGEWEEEGVGEGEEVVDRLIAMLPNDLFCLHWMLLGWKRDEVERGRVQRLAERDRRRSTPALHSPTSSSSAVALSPLVALLVQMDDPPPYLSLADNLYILLSSGFPTLAVPPLPPFPSSSRTERLSADMLSYVLSLLPRVMPPSTPSSSSSSSASVLTILAAEAQRAESTGNAATAITVTECIALLSSSLPSTNIATFLSSLYTHLHSYHSLLTSSPLPSRLLLCTGEVERRQEELKRQEAEVRDGLRGLGVRRVMEMVRVRVKRLRKFLAQRSDKEKDKLPPQDSNKPANGSQLLDSAQQSRDRKVSTPSSSPLYVPPPPAYLSTLLTSGGCGGGWPADVQSDRFLCAGCMRLLDKRRVLLRSFYNKYVIGEPIGTTATGDGALSGMGASPSLAVPLPLAPAVSSPAVLSASTLGNSNSSISSSSSSVPPPTAGVSIGTEPGLGHTLLNLSLGPPLNLLDQAVMCDLNDLICSAVWDEVWVDCERGEKQWWVECEALRQQLLNDGDETSEEESVDRARMDDDEVMRRAFEVWYALMALGEREVGGDSGVTVAHVRRQLQRRQPTTADRTDQQQQPLQRKLQQLIAPWLSSHTVSAFERELYGMLHSKSCRDKLDCIGRMRSIVFATLSNGSMIALRRRQQGDTSQSDVEAGSVDDYMSLLSFLLVWLNPLGVLPHLSFLRLLHVPAAQHKAMVDVLTAVKYVYFMQQSFVSAKAGASGAVEFALNREGLKQRAQSRDGRPNSSVDGMARERGASGSGGLDGVVLNRSLSQSSGLTAIIGGRHSARSLSSLDE